MRHVFLSKKFQKAFAKLTVSVQEAFIERSKLFIHSPRDARLYDHLLTGEWAGYRSINVTGDYRALYREITPGIVEFVAIGTHPELYGK